MPRKMPPAHRRTVDRLTHIRLLRLLVTCVQKQLLTSPLTRCAPPLNSISRANVPRETSRLPAPAFSPRICSAGLPACRNRWPPVPAPRSRPAGTCTRAGVRSACRHARPAWPARCSLPMRAVHAPSRASAAGQGRAGVASVQAATTRRATRNGRTEWVTRLQAISRRHEGCMGPGRQAGRGGKDGKANGHERARPFLALQRL